VCCNVTKWRTLFSSKISHKAVIIFLFRNMYIEIFRKDAKETYLNIILQKVWKKVCGPERKFEFSTARRGPAPHGGAR
jgi:hypothetical protein